ncbi:cytochrome c [Mesorhizobium sp. CAU 1741]|uniref:c-type cytochrome n=1 Tax=Mesorhizobium sp. CAU 1741 TaxID=3140366 RepID=UPI00325BA1D3
MRFLVCVATAISLSAVAASADPIEDRQALMKERGAVMRILGPIAQGREPFEADKVLEALEELNANAQATTDVDALWPEGSDSGGDNDSAPAVWEDREGFVAATNKYAADAAAAAEAAPQDLEAFRAVFGPVASNCGSCHEAYRL